MTDRIDAIIERTIGKEGGYVNHPNDPGGETNWGITVGTARAAGYGGPMRGLSRSVAKDIYRKTYFTKPGFDRIGQISMAIAEELFDTGVNMGPAWGATFLQRALNALNDQGRHYGDIKVDGQAGPATRAALDAFLRRRGRKEGETVLLKALNVLQGARYIDLAEKRQKNESFLYGWLRTRVELPHGEC